MKKENEIKGIKNTIFLLKKTHLDKRIYVKLILIYVVSAISAIFTAIFNAKIIEHITSANFDSFVVIVLCLGLANAIKMIFQNFQTIFNVKLQNMMVKEINNCNYKRVLSLEVSNFNNNSSEEFQNRIYSANQISTVITNSLANLYDTIYYLSYSFVILFYCPLLSSIYIIYSILSVTYRKLLTPYINNLYNKNWKNNGISMNSLSREAIVGIKDIKSLNMVDQIIIDYDKKQTKYYNEQTRINTFSAKTNFIMSFFALIRDISVPLLGYYLYTKNMLTIPKFILFMTYKSNITSLFNNISSFIVNISDVEANAIRGAQLYDDKIFSSEKFGDVNRENLKGNIKINNLDFSYENDRQLFKNLNLTIESNKINAIVGRSGEGKTTILSLINKFYNVDNDKIFIDDIDINEYNENTIRNNIAYIQQSPYIFNMTFRENLLLIKPNATEEELIDVCKKSEIYDFICSTKNGLDTIIGENGITISGGQKQRLAIARALLNNANIIMFDESTSSLDNESQNKIQKVIEKLSVDHTIIIVAHRLSTIKNADKIIFIKNHMVKAVGNHSELILSCEDYKNLYKIESIN